MTTDPLQAYRGLPSARLLEDGCRQALERSVAAYLGCVWQIRTFADMNDYSSHPAAILADGARAVFAKRSDAENALEQFEAELAGLGLLAERGGAAIPTLIGLVELDGGGVVMLQEAVQPVERGEREWRAIGQTLARIHQTSGAACGLERQGYFGPLYQDNRPLPGWLEFFAERRLWPRLAGTINSGHLSSDVIRRVERLGARLTRMGLPEAAPVLLHGDAQVNNYISTQTGALVIDPAVFYGSAEYDLAHLDYFQPVPQALFDAYNDILPIPAGFAQRRDLWRIPALLAAVEVEGGIHLPRLLSALKKYE